MSFSKNNAKIYYEMFQLYDEIEEIKKQLDLLIKQGKTYYCDYKIIGRIVFSLEESVKNNGEDFDSAESEWKIETSYGKKLPSKTKALDLWKQHLFEHEEVGEWNYINRATYDFLFPKVDRNHDLYAHWHKIPFDIFSAAEPNCFERYIQITIGKYKVERDFSRDEEMSETEKTFGRKEKPFEIFNFFEKRKVLKLARRMLELEVETNHIGDQIEKDFAKLAYEGHKIFSDIDMDRTIHYDFHHAFGRKSKMDMIHTHYVEIMNFMSCMTSGSKDMKLSSETTQNCDPPCFRFEPYRYYHMSWTNHALWDHCGLSNKEILRMNPKKFCSWFDITLIFPQE